MTSINDTTEIPSWGDRVDSHRDQAMDLAERSENLAQALKAVPLNSEQYRRIDKQLGVSLKLASIHAHLALAIAGPSVYVSEINA